MVGLRAGRKVASLVEWMVEKKAAYLENSMAGLLVAEKVAQKAATMAGYWVAYSAER